MGEKQNKSDAAKEREIFEAVLELESAAECRKFFYDLCTPQEIRSLADRWHVATLVFAGLPYRRIQEISGVCTATITRVARALNYGEDGYRLMLDRRSKEENQ